KGADSFGLLGLFSAPIKYALLYWQRKSELSCDRAGAVVTSPETVARVMVRLAGGPKAITDKVNIAEWARQAAQYEQLRNDGMWNKALQTYAVMGTDHPFAAVRVREILRWGESAQYRTLKSHTSSASGDTCPNCHKPVDRDWQFCRYCGTKIK
ncbi:MAG: zinc-ribbon domain-containing protein, partial [Duncaniella sp.]|nr:zinc-ribbon domain-containing protein [Duncaniella sp.]